MLLLLIILLLVVNSNGSCHQDSNVLNTKSSSRIIPHHVRIQHIDVDTHPDIVIDVQKPHFSWQLSHEYDNDGHLMRGIQQLAYHILVTTVIDDEVVWDSGYVPSSSSIHIFYAGTSFTSDTRYTD